MRLFGTSKITFSEHNYIHQFFNYLGVFIFAIILTKIESYTSNVDDSSTNIPSRDSDSNKSAKIVLIHNEDLNDFDYSEIIYTGVFTIFILVIAEQFLLIYGSTMKDLDFWMFEIAILSYISSKMFNLTIHIHQKLGLILNCFSCLFKFGSIISSIYENKDPPVIYAKYNIFVLGIICFLVYMISITLRAYSNSKLKWLMDLRYIRVSRILILHGLMGTIICLVISIVSTFIKCKDFQYDNIDFNYYICHVTNNTYIIDNNNNKDNITTQLYFENFKLYFEKYKSSNGKEIIFEIALILLIMIISFFLKYFILLIIKYLTPLYATFYLPIYFLFQKLLLGLYSLIRTGNFFVDHNKYRISKFHFDISGDLLSIIGFLIYLEIIELNFCNLNYNIKRKMILRCLGEIKEMGSFDSNFSEEDTVEEKEVIE